MDKIAPKKVESSKKSGNAKAPAKKTPAKAKSPVKKTVVKKKDHKESSCSQEDNKKAFREEGCGEEVTILL